MIKRVFLNAGHDVKCDSGAINPVMGLREADVAKTIAEMTAEALIHVGYDVLSMQDDDLDAVCNAANEFNADVFVSIHCNACNGNARGTETLHNKDSVIGSRLANNIQMQVVNTLQSVDRGLKPRPVWSEQEQRYKGNIQVLNQTNMPACLVEVAFIDNKDDVRFLDNDKDRRAIANAIARGISDFSQKH